MWYKWSWLVGISERVGLLLLAASSFEVSEVAEERGLVRGVKLLKGGVDEGELGEGSDGGDEDEVGEGGDGEDWGERGPS